MDFGGEKGWNASEYTTFQWDLELWESED
jgi:hypothetical protein